MDSERYQEWRNHKNNKCKKKIQVFYWKKQINLLNVKKKYSFFLIWKYISFTQIAFFFITEYSSVADISEI